MTSASLLSAHAALHIDHSPTIHTPSVSPIRSFSRFGLQCSNDEAQE